MRQSLYKISLFVIAFIVMIGIISIHPMKAEASSSYKFYELKEGKTKKISNYFIKYNKGHLYYGKKKNKLKNITVSEYVYPYFTGIACNGKYLIYCTVSKKNSVNNIIRVSMSNGKRKVLKKLKDNELWVQYAVGNKVYFIYGDEGGDIYMLNTKTWKLKKYSGLWVPTMWDEESGLGRKYLTRYTDDYEDVVYKMTQNGLKMNN